jgi:hypothetical protein
MSCQGVAHEQYLHAGVTADEVQQRFGQAGWQLIDAKPTSAETPRATRADERFELWHYRLRRAPI